MKNCYSIIVMLLGLFMLIVGMFPPSAFTLVLELMALVVAVYIIVKDFKYIWRKWK